MKIIDCFYRPKVRLLNAHKDRDRRFSITGASDTIEEDTMNELRIQAADMPLHMQKAAVQSTSHAIKLYTTEKHIAESIKQDFDQLFQPTWHCIVGRNWGSCVTHSKASGSILKILFSYLLFKLYFLGLLYSYALQGLNYFTL
jgi:dynein light chain LC8-type